MLTESEVLVLVREGFNIAEIAEALGKSRPVAEIHFMRAVGAIDREARAEQRRRIQQVHDYKRRKLAGSGQSLR